MLDMRPMLFVAVILALLLAGLFVHAQAHKVTLKGKLFSDGTECHFFLDSETDAPNMGIDASSSWILCDYLKGSNAKPFIIVLIPE